MLYIDDLQFLKDHYSHIFTFNEDSACTYIYHEDVRIAYVFNRMPHIFHANQGFHDILWNAGYRRKLDNYELAHILRAWQGSCWMDEYINNLSKKFKKDKEFISYIHKTTRTRGRIVKNTITGKWYRSSVLPERHIRDTDTIVRCLREEIREIAYDYDGFWYSHDHPKYYVQDRYMPLHYIIENCYECEEHNTVYLPAYGCPVCREMYKIHDYSTNVVNLLGWRTDPKDPVYLGIELEYETPREMRTLVYKELKDHMVLKRDGSLHQGFEIVTAPASMNIHLEQFKKFSFDLMKVESTCGMHVHVGKDTLSALQVGKILAFIYNAENTTFIHKVAGRKTAGHQFCNSSHNRTFTTGYIGRSSHYEKGKHRQENNHHTALNISNKGTIEFRIFSSPSSYEDFKMKLEFVRAMVAYTSSAVVNAPLDMIKKASTFLSWLKSERKTYPTLYQFVGA